jgi:hypothetical protein
MLPGYGDAGYAAWPGWKRSGRASDFGFDKSCERAAHAYVYVKDIQIPAIARKGGSAEGAEGNLPYFFLNKA